jgi:hypothetical protein
VTKCCKTAEKAGEKGDRIFKKEVAKYTKKARGPENRGEIGYLRKILPLQ